MNNDIIKAISKMKLIEFDYDGEYRLVEPHAYGVSKKGNELLRGYQTEGGTKNGVVPDWRLFSVNKIENLNVKNESFECEREGYKRGDSVLNEIFAEL
jgi:hypothetical protein